MLKFSVKKDPFRERELCKYPNPIPSREYIMQCLKEIGTPVTGEEITKAFRLKSAEDIEAIRCRLIAMARDGQIVSNRRGSYILVDKTSLVRGVVSAHKEGFGFLLPEDGGEDIFLPPKQMRSIFHNDRILVQVINEGGRGRLEGAIVEILERNTKTIVGRYFEEGGVAFIAASNKKITQDIIIPKNEQDGAKHGQLVVAEIVSYPTSRRQATGKIVEILGDHLAPGLEIDVAIRAYGLPYAWSDEITTETANIKPTLQKSDYKNRKDLRDLPLVTIDGEDAKDFDDAVYCHKTSHGGWQLYVAIADVSHYVKPNTALDQEAMQRGTSVYFPHLVVPMLPEILSNELCSLKPNVDRLCMVCEMTFAKDGKITRYDIYDAVMRSSARLTYNLVADMLAGKKNPHPKLLPDLKTLYALFHILKKQREQRGAIEFETVETRIIFGKDKKITKIVPVIRNDAHRIIEECMVAANVCTAKFLLKKKIPALYRVHEGPTAEKLTNLHSFLNCLGLHLTGGENPKPIDYTKLLSKTKNRKDQHLIQKMLLRSMRQAVYDEENIGHFGLAYEAYGHFTSPIRRYPDLLTHRAIRHAIKGGKAADFYYDTNTIHNFGEHCSMTERRADDATRDATDWLKCEYMVTHVGKKFEGIISGVMGFGLFVELKDIYVEGLVHITSLLNDFYQFDPMRQCLRGKRTGKVYRLGDPIKVRVARVNLDEREIDLEPVK
jgi:ribonuclease R